jgi:hypothetical protein
MHSTKPLNVPLMTAKQKINTAADEIRTWGAVAVVGAGASLMSGFPLSKQLTNLIWTAIDSDPNAHSDLSKRFKKSNKSAKELIGDDPARIQLAYKVLERHLEARRVFQDGFASLDRARRGHISQTHGSLAELIHRGIVGLTVSLNWDTLLESAYELKYGVTLGHETELLFKPHGSADRPHLPWVLPHQSGLVPSNLLSRIKELTRSRPRVLLVIGYSERDKEVVQNLIGPLEKRWRVIRVGPSATGANDVPLIAEKALPMLLETIAPSPELFRWEHVTFNVQRGFADALLGHRLGPQNVEACPQLPELQSALRSLSLAHRVIIGGTSGSGKSITAYQAAYNFHEKGFEVLQPQRNPPLVEALKEISDLNHPSVIVVDDAHLTSADFRTGLLSMASDQLKVILTVTDSTASFHGEGLVETSPKRSVELLAKTVDVRKKELMPFIIQLDDQIGDHYMKIPLSRRLLEAGQADTPWQFSFILTGGWRRARDELAAVQTHAGADWVLLAIAIGQIVSLDQGITASMLARMLKALNQRAARLGITLKVLRTRRMVIGSDRLRCPHLRYAIIILQLMARRPDPRLTLLIRAALECQPPLRGIAWVTNELRLTDAFRGSGELTVIYSPLVREILTRCWTAGPGEPRRDAIFAVNQIVSTLPELISELDSEVATLSRWLTTPDGVIAYALGHLINSISQAKVASALQDRLYELTDPATVASHVNGLTKTEGFSWGYLLGRLGAVSPKSWKRAFSQHLDWKRLTEVVREVTFESMSDIDQLIGGCYVVNRKLGLALLSNCMRPLSEAINVSPTRAYEELREIESYVLGSMITFFDGRPPSGSQLNIGKRILRPLNAKLLAAEITNGSLRDWENQARLLWFISLFIPAKCRTVGQLIDWSAVDALHPGIWPDPPDELLRIIVVTRRTQRRTHPQILKHEREIQKLSWRLALLAPDVVTRRIEEGLHLPLVTGIPPLADWDAVAAILFTLARISRETAVKVLTANAAQLSSALTTLQNFELEHLNSFLSVCKRIARKELTAIIEHIEVHAAEENWFKAVATPTSKRLAVKRSVLRLAKLAVSLGGPVGEMAERVTKRINTMCPQ